MGQQIEYFDFNQSSIYQYHCPLEGQEAYNREAQLSH